MDLVEIKNDFFFYRKYFGLYNNVLMEMIEKENRIKEYNVFVCFEIEKKLQEI